MIYARQMQFLWCHLMRYVPVHNLDSANHKINRTENTQFIFFSSTLFLGTYQQTYTSEWIISRAARSLQAPFCTRFGCVFVLSIVPHSLYDSTSDERQRIEIAKRSVKTFLDGIPIRIGITWKMQQIISPHKRQWSFVMFSRENKKRERRKKKQTRNEICMKHIFGRFI